MLKRKLLDFDGWRYNHNPESWRTIRHRFLARFDVVLALVAAVLAVMTTGYVRSYFLVVLTLFMISATYHWLAWSCLLNRLDQFAIMLLVAGTPLPYVPHIWEHGDPLALGLLGAGVCCFGALLVLKNLGEEVPLVPQAAYLIVGCVAVYAMWPVASVMPDEWRWWFWGGVVLHVLGFISYNRSWLDFYPDQFGYHESMRVKIAAAIFMQSVAAIRFV